jgi:hypothetical protein
VNVSDDSVYLESTPISQGLAWSHKFDDVVSLRYTDLNDPSFFTGYLNVTLAHDVAVTTLTPSKTVVGQGYSTNVSVMVTNHGDFAETFDVTLYANATSIALQTVNLGSGTSETVVFTWNTAGFVNGNYYMRAVAETVPGEIETLDNARGYRSVIVTTPGDINGDKIVNVLDLHTLGRAYGATPISVNWKPNLDINNDLIINMLDLRILNDHWGQSW